MRKSFLLFCCLLFMCASARATTITVSSYSAPSGWQYGSPLTLRVYVNQTFVDSDGIVHMAQATGGGNFYRSISCTSSSGTINIPSFTIASTTDSPTNPNATYSFIFYDKNGVRRDTFVAALPIPTILGTTVTWGRLFTYLAGHPVPPRPGFPDIQQVQALINAVLPAPKASDVVNGILQTSVAPVDSVNPEALGTNDSRVGTTYNPMGSPFNAACDGSTDDTAAFQALNLVIGSNKATIKLPGNRQCRVGNLTLPANEIIDFSEYGSLQGINSSTLTFAAQVLAGSYQIFYNYLAGQATVSFASNPAQPAFRPQWWKTNTTPGTTDMTTAIQAALTATGGQGAVFVPRGSYLVTNTLTFPNLGAGNSAVTFYGDGPNASNLINKASASKPTLSLTFGEARVHDLGFWGDNSFPNDGIRAIGGPSTYPSRVRIWNNTFWLKGNGIYLESLHSAWITNNTGVTSSGSGLIPTGVTTPAVPTSGTESFIYINQPIGGFTIQIVIANNMNESYVYPVYSSGVSVGAGQIDWIITGNQFEGSTNGLKLDFVSGLVVTGNYLGESSTGYAIACNECSGAHIGPNEIHFSSLDAINSTVKLNDCTSTVLEGTIPRLYLTGTVSSGVTFDGGLIYRVQDETSDHHLSMVNVFNSVIGAVPKNTLNMKTGSSAWDSNDPTAIVAYPTVRLNDRVSKTTVAAGASLGWYCTTASSAGSLVQTVGVGPGPALLTDYSYPIAYDYEITVVTGGASGTATYNVGYKVQGSGSPYVLLTASPMTSTELAHLVVADVGGGAPGVSISLRWPPAQTYVSGNKWTITNAVAAVWSPINPYLRGTVGINPASINANTVSSQTFTLTGAAVGDTLTLNLPAAGLTAGLVVQQTFVSTTNTVTIVFWNSTAAPINEPSGDWTFQLSR